MELVLLPNTNDVSTGEPYFDKLPCIYRASLSVKGTVFYIFLYLH